LHKSILRILHAGDFFMVERAGREASSGSTKRGAFWAPQAVPRT